MADSELESGAVVSPQEAISEIVCTEFDEPTELAASMKNQCNFIEQSSLSREPKCSTDEISDYENRVLSDPFYESNEESDDDNNQANFQFPMTSLEQFKSISLANSTHNESDEKIAGREVVTQNGKKLNTLNQGLEINNSSSASSNYYFIDASSLNDDVDVITTNIVGYPNDLNGSLTWSSSITQLNSNCYIPTCRANNFFLKDDSFKMANQKMGNAQNEFDEIAGLDQQLKLLEPFTEVRKTRKLDTLLVADNLSILKNTNKESLVVEIKEADSGESTQHSPCPDNTNIDNSQEKKKESNSHLQQENTHEDHREDADKKPLLIRRNTFELDATDEKLSSLRQEYERRQGSLVFQNSITQYSQHHLDGHPYLDGATETNSILTVDLNLNTESPLIVDNSNLDKKKYVVDNGEKKIDEGNSTCYKNGKSETVGSLARSASDKFLVKYDDSDELSFNSLPVITAEELDAPQVKSRLRRNEAAPIVSGGASCSDFQKPTDSPTVKRKTEATPIVSGGSVIIPIPSEEEQAKAKRRTASMSSSMTAWVVDMSDCRSSNNSDKHSAPRKTRDSLNQMSSSFSPAANAERSRDIECEKEQPQHSSLGYFVNLDSVTSPRESSKHPANKHKRRPSDLATEKNYCEFFVDLSEKPIPTKVTHTAIKAELPEKPRETREIPQESPRPVAPSDSKKNIFSMFIELNDAGARTGQVAKSSSSASLSQRRSTEDQSDKAKPDKKPKSGVFMFIESDSPLVRRRTLSSSRPAFKRHSWNTDKAVEQGPQSSTDSESQKQTDSSNPEKEPTRVHKRAQSLSVERPVELRRLLSQRSSSSSQSLNEMAAKEDLNPTSDYDMRDTPPNSHVELASDELLVSLRSRNYQELDAISEQTTAKPALESNPQATESSETVQNSLWDKTPTENDSTENNQTRKSETFDIISSSASGPSSGSDNIDLKINPFNLIDATQQRLSRSFSKASDTQREHKTKKAIRPTASASFVRLSDLDKRPVLNKAQAAPRSEETTQRCLNSNVAETSWIESKLVMSARNNETIHRAINKKFSISLAAGPARSEHFDDFNIEGDGETAFSESDLSSLQSSMGRSGQGSTEETETSTSFALGKPYNRLGEDLLRMFLEEINPDVTIDVAGRRIRAHKCILSSRCQYFAAILSGGWVESAGNVISLQGYSYNAVHFALCHIYSGESCIPDSISIVELATLADMLCLEGLKEVIGFTLKVKYCHLFHKPCNGCAVGVLECMPLAAAYGLDEVYRKSLRWITRHFVRIWPSKEFATLPRELMDKCYHQQIVYMSIDNVLQTIMDCDKLLTILPNVRWAEPVFRLVSNLLDASMKYLTDNFAGVLGTDNFQSLDRELTWNISRLEDHLLAAAERLPPEQACRTYSKLDKLFAAATHSIDAGDCVKSTKWSSLFTDLMNKIRGQVEKCLVRDAPRAVRSNAWLKMDLELRRRIQELACLVIIPNEAPTKRPSRHSNFLKEPKERPEVKMPISRVTTNRTLDLRKVKMTMSEHNERTQKQTPLLQTRKIMNKPKTDPLERKLQNDKVSDMSNVLRPKSWPNKIEVKSRYLEPRNRPTTKESPLQGNQEKSISQQRKKIMISSSDSSRTSSPAMKRAAEKKALLSQPSKVPVKKDGKALSSDSLSETNYRGNLKKEIASKSCGITRPESPSLKPKEIESGLSVDSLADSKKKPLIKTARINRMDTSMSTDSLMTDITAVTTPKSTTTNKSSPTLGKSATSSNVNQTRGYDRLKKSSPPSQQRNTPTAVRRPTRSLESSTAASRNRAAAVVSTYNGSLSLRKSLLDAAKAPDIPNKTLNSAAITRTSLRQTSYSVKSSLGSLSMSKVDKSEKKDDNQRPIVSPGSKRSSPKANISSRLVKSTVASNKQKINRLDEKSSAKSKAQISNADKDGPKFLNQSSRSGTFLKDEPTILNKSDIETAAIDV